MPSRLRRLGSVFSLLLLGTAAVAAADAGSVRVSLVSDLPDADPGSLWAIQDPRVADTSAQGGAIDAIGTIGARTIAVESLLVGAQRFAFVLRTYTKSAGEALPTDPGHHLLRDLSLTD